jgi:hypothetical protein
MGLEMDRLAEHLALKVNRLNEESKADRNGNYVNIKDSGC